MRGGKSRRTTTLLLSALVLLSLPLTAQNIPDAPTPKTQPGQFPDSAPAANKNTHPEATPEATPAPTPPPAQPTAAQGGVVTDRTELPAFSIRVNFVQVPVTVKDGSGRLVPDLGPTDFAVYEDKVPQKLVFFSGDPFPLSAAVVVETDLPVSTMKKVNETLPSLVGAFSDFDEVALYRYGHTVQQVAAFTGATSVSTAMLTRVKRPGRDTGPAMIGGPMSSGPTINGHSIDPNAGGQAIGATPPKESFVLNDAILRAANDLAKRDRTRRKIIFVISDGRESGSNSGYDEVKKILLSNNIGIYALAVDTAAIPIYDRLNRIRVPGIGTGDILPKYASDTGGDLMAEFDRQGIEQAYAKITEVARNQYTLGYTTRATKSSGYREIEVKVHRPNLVVQAKPGYYPLPPQPPSSPRP